MFSLHIYILKYEGYLYIKIKIKKKKHIYLYTDCGVVVHAKAYTITQGILVPRD